MTETVLFDLAQQETTNSAPLSRNICFNFLMISLLSSVSCFSFFTPPSLCLGMLVYLTNH